MVKMDLNTLPNLNTAVREIARNDPVRLLETETISQALTRLRHEGIGERIIYFYVTGNDGKLAGVVPTRRLILSDPTTLVGEVMVPSRFFDCGIRTVRQCTRNADRKTTVS